MPIDYQKDIDNNPQSQTSALFQYFLMQEQKTDITLTSSVSLDDIVISVSSGHGFVAASGEMIVIWEGSRFMQAVVIGVSVNDITIEIPSAIEFSTNAVVIRGNKNMNVDGSSSPVDFLFKMYDASIPIDISKVMITMQHGANVPDDGKFGGLAALTNGVYFRQVNGARLNLGNYTKNSDFKDRGASVEYTDKAPAGTNGTNIKFEIENTFGQVIRIDPRVGSTICATVRDKIDSGEGMALLSLSLIGSYTQGE
jgi:hypothetical protein